jgi:hypothetical protein
MVSSVFWGLLMYYNSKNCLVLETVGGRDAQLVVAIDHVQQES